MTTLAEREHAFEAHYAMLELAAFKARLLHFRDAGYRIAAAAGLQGADATRFAEEVALLGVQHPRHRELCPAVAALAAERGTAISPAGIEQLLSDHDAQRPLPAAARDAKLPWAGFVMEQMLLLFGLDREPPPPS